MTIRLTRSRLLAGALAVLAAASVSTAIAAQASDPRPAAPVVSGVTLTGTRAAPVLTITWTGLPKRPTGTPVTALPNCSGIGTGFDFLPTKLWFVDVRPGKPVWTAGLLTGTFGSCVGLVISSWSRTKIVLRFGDRFPSTVDQWVLRRNDSFVIGLNGMPLAGVVPADF